MSNFMIRRYGGDMEGELDLETYTKTCYWEFLELLNHPSWSVMGNLVHESKSCGIL